MLYAILANDQPDAPDLRREHLEAHLAFIAEQSERIRVAGPLLDERGEKVGSLLVIEAESLPAARAWIATDPYARAGVWRRIVVRPFRAVAGAWVGGITWARH